MKLSKVQIKNFRSFKDETINLDDYTCLVGENGSGKSTVLTALNVFFRKATPSFPDVTRLTEEDFYNKNTKDPVEIILTFENLSAEAQKELQHYYRQGKLIFVVKAEWGQNKNCAETMQLGYRMVMPDFAEFFDAADKKANAQELKEIYTKIREKHPELPPPSSRPSNEQALRTYEEEHPELCSLISDPTQAYGFTRGVNRLEKFIQWFYVPAVKDASSEQDEGKSTVLGDLLQKTIRDKIDFSGVLDPLRSEVEERYRSLINEKNEELQYLSQSLERRLQSWSHPGSRLQINWHYDSGKSLKLDDPYARARVGEREFLGEISRLGHGLQRSFLLALLQEQASGEMSEGPTMLLAVEEPELYQHPPQARHFARVLEQLSRQNAQIIVTTHSPYFISGKGFEAVRKVGYDHTRRSSRVRQLSYEALTQILNAAVGAHSLPSTVMAQVEQILQPSQAELFFASIPVLVEGLEDVAFIATYLHLTDGWSKFRRLGCHFVVADGKTSMSRPLAIAKGLEIPIFVIFDADGDEQKAENERDNKCLLKLCGASATNPYPTEILWGDNYTVWPRTIRDAVKDDIGDDTWTKASETARVTGGLYSLKEKNQLVIAAILEELWKNSVRCRVLEKLCDRILSCAERITAS